MPDDRLAVLIDADNTSPRRTADIFDELARFGRVTVRRAYGDWTTSQLGGWKAAIREHAISPVQQFANTVGKNSTDSALIIDAMDLLYSGNVDAFALVSSDSDFTRLATRLRESGRTVYGLGERKTPGSLVGAVDQFVYLDLLGSTDAPAADDDDTRAATPPPDLQGLLTNAVMRAAQDDDWASLGGLSNQLRAAYPAFDPRLYKFPRLLPLVQAQPYLTVEVNGNSTRVALKSKKSAAARTESRAKRGAAKKPPKSAS